MDRIVFLFLAAILAGFALIKVPLGDFLWQLQPIISIIGVLTVLVFSSVIIFRALMALIGKKF